MTTVEKAVEDKIDKNDKTSFAEIVKVFFNAIFTSVIVIAALVVAIVWILPMAFGARPVTVLSGSMDPTFSAGDVIWVDTDKENVGIGQIIVFHPEAYNNDLVTHRVIATNTGSEKTYVTQGDNNNSSDDPIVEGQIVGVVKPPLSYIGVENSFISFPKVGYLQQHLLTIGVIIISLSIVMWVISAFISKSRKKGENPNE